MRLYEELPTEGMEVETPWSDIWLSPADWAEAFEAVDPGTPHNDARDEIWQALLEILVDKHDTDDEVPPELLRRALGQHLGLRETFSRVWPMIEAEDLVGDLWSVPAYLRRCAPWLDARRGEAAAAQARAGGVDAVGPAAPGRSAAAARRPGRLAGAAAGGVRAAQPGPRRWPTSSTTWSRATTARCW